MSQLATKNHKRQLSMKEPVSLRRALSLYQITFYGIGTILGAGIYVLLGEVANTSGMGTPLAFLVSAVIVSFSAYSYAKLSSQFPQSAGEAVYVIEGLRSSTLATIVGFAIVLGGTVSAAPLVNGFIGYFRVFASVPDSLVIIALVSVFCGIICWGVKQSVGVAVITTLIEIAGLIMIFISGAPQLTQAGTDWQQFLSPGVSSVAIISGAYLAFYAFIGFEDMVNMAEEVKNPKRNLPLAIALALVITTLLYAAVAVVALSTVPLPLLAKSDAPLALIIEHGGMFPADIMAMIGLIAILNGAMIQIMMASRVFYGMANRQLLPEKLARKLGAVNRHTRTPITATVLVSSLVAGFALWLPLVTLAKVTSSLILGIFILVNLSLAAIYWRTKQQWRCLIPLTGALLCTAFAGAQLLN